MRPAAVEWETEEAAAARAALWADSVPGSSPSAVPQLQQHQEEQQEQPQQQEEEKVEVALTWRENVDRYRRSVEEAAQQQPLVGAGAEDPGVGVSAVLDAGTPPSEGEGPPCAGASSDSSAGVGGNQGPPPSDSKSPFVESLIPSEGASLGDVLREQFSAFWETWGPSLGDAAVAPSSSSSSSSSSSGDNPWAAYARRQEELRSQAQPEQQPSPGLQPLFPGDLPDDELPQEQRIRVRQAAYWAAKEAKKAAWYRSREREGTRGRK